jgi:hypothetical protein
MAKSVKLKVTHIFRGAGDKGTDLKFVAGQTYDEDLLKKNKIDKNDYVEDTEEKK